MSNNNVDADGEDGKAIVAKDLDYQAILLVAKQAAKAAGAEIQRVWWEETNSLTIKSSNVDLVTETDEIAEQLIMKIIHSNYPTHQIIGEESSGADCHYTLTDQPTWTIDPIDGTTNFVDSFLYFSSWKILNRKRTSWDCSAKTNIVHL